MAENKVDQEKLKVRTTEFRVSHPHVFKPSSMPGDSKLTYSIEMLFDKKTTNISELQAPLKAAATAKWGAKEDWPTPLSLPIRDGDKPHGKKKEIKPEHAGQWVVRASSSAEYSKPHVVNKDPSIPITEESEFYPGCYARAALKAHAWSFADKDGVKFVLDGVQKIRDGKAFGGKKPADQVFGVIQGDDGDADFGSTEDADEDSFM
jgi:Protein of unknown function (DUF2815)